MKKYIQYSSLIFAGIALMSSGVASAEINANVSATATTQVNAPLLKVRADMKAEVKDERMDNRDEIEASRKEFRKDMSAKMIEMKGKITTQRENFKKSLLKIKDEKKRATAENINVKVQDLNAKATDQFSASISRIENVLVNIEARINSSGVTGADVSAVTANNAVAVKAIADAKAAIVIQSGKIYTINVTDEKTLRAEAQKVRDALNTDLRAVNEKVKVAHNAVRLSADMLVKIPNIDADFHSNTQVEGKANSNNN